METQKTLSNGITVRWASDWCALVLDTIEGRLPEIRTRFHRTLYGHTEYIYNN